jgi:hypothetical protein
VSNELSGGGGRLVTTSSCARRCQRTTAAENTRIHAELANAVSLACTAKQC